MESYTHPLIQFQCRLSFHCCCCYYYCCPRLEILRDAPFASLTPPVVRRLHLSFRFPVPNFVLRVAEVQVAVGLAEAVTPNRCHCYCYCCPPFPDGARGCAPIGPQGDVSCAEAPHLPVPWRPEQNDPPVVRDLQWSSPRLLPCENDNVLNVPPLVYALPLR